MNELITISNVRGYLDENGTAQLNLEDVSRGLGFTQLAKSRNEVIRWERVRRYLAEFGFAQRVEGKSIPTSGDEVNSQEVGKEGLPEFIPENIFYKLCFKASNEKARTFQNEVTDIILPTIRKHGAYLTQQKIEEVLLNPDTIIQLAMTLKKEREEKQQLQLENKIKDQQISELKPKADYTDRILSSKGTVTITAIAKDYGMTGVAFNKLLHKLKIQYKQGDIWLLYKEHQSKGYTHSKSFDYKDRNGLPQARMQTQWTQKGRLFLYELLKANDILPMIERYVSA